LFISVEKIRSGVKTSFAQTISGTDIIVGARSSSLNVLLNSIFHIGISENMIQYNTFTRFKNHPMVDWAVPLSFGDSYRGNRVIGTTQDFFRRYQYRNHKPLAFSQGREFSKITETVIGSAVAKEANLIPGSTIILSHGISENAVLTHDDNPFTVIGILEKTNTPVDHSVFVSLEAIEVIHKNWQSGAYVENGEKVNIDNPNNYNISKISSFFLGCKSRLDVLTLQRETSQYIGEPLSVAIPGMALAELWQTLKIVEKALFSIGILAGLVSLLSMLIAVLTSLQQRRREIAILRALGVGPRKLFWLMTLESGFLSAFGLLLGFVLSYGLLFLLQEPIEMLTGIEIVITFPGTTELLYGVALLSIGFGVGFLPGALAYRMTLRDGLSMRL